MYSAQNTLLNTCQKIFQKLFFKHLDAYMENESRKADGGLQWGGRDWCWFHFAPVDRHFDHTSRSGLTNLQWKIYFFLPDLTYIPVFKAQIQSSFVSLLIYLSTIAMCFLRDREEIIEMNESIFIHTSEKNTNIYFLFDCSLFIYTHCRTESIPSALQVI